MLKNFTITPALALAALGLVLAALLILAGREVPDYLPAVILAGLGGLGLGSAHGAQQARRVRRS
jgi:hypothetical protein